MDRISEALGVPPPATLADIGAGTGNYGRALADLGYFIEAVEPSEVMRSQADPHPSVRWHPGFAEKLPLPDHSVEAVLCILSVHHFSSAAAAAAEMARVCATGPIVWLTFDLREAHEPWLAEYFPTVWDEATSRTPPIREVCEQVGEITGREVELRQLPIPWDLEDHFLSSGWRRPELYLDPAFRAGMSSFQLCEAEAMNTGLRRLESDLESGEWKGTNRELLDRPSVDWGYRILIARIP